MTAVDFFPDRRRHDVPTGEINKKQDAPLDGPGRDNDKPSPVGQPHQAADYIFLALVLLSAGCFSVLATLPLFLLGLVMAGYLAFKLTAPGSADPQRDGGDRHHHP